MYMSVEIKLLDISSLSDQLKVYTSVFGDVSESYWIDKHYHNPYGRSLIFGAYINNILVGINCFQPYVYGYSNIKFRVLQSCESGVLKEYQGKGIWSKLMSFAYDYILKYGQYDMLIGFPNYLTSYSGFIKQGWQKQFTMINYVMINNVKVFAKAFIGKNFIVYFFSYLLLLQKLIINIRYYCSKNRISISQCKPSDVSLNTNINVLHVAYDAKFLEWKVLYKKFKCIKVCYNGENIAYCIYGTTRHKEVPVITINKLSYIENSPISLANIMASICKFISKDQPKAAYVRTWAMPDDLMNKLLKSLFFKKMSHPNPFITKYIHNDISSLKWDISLLDLD